MTDHLLVSHRHPGDGSVLFARVYDRRNLAPHPEVTLRRTGDGVRHYIAPAVAAFRWSWQADRVSVVDDGDD